jgi:hypothetical protein
MNSDRAPGSSGTESLVAESTPKASVVIEMRSKVRRLEEAGRHLPQATLITNHYWADGMYCRSVWRPAGCLIVGKVHRKEHFYIVAKGCVEVVMDDGPKVLEAGTVLVSKPGTKRVVLALEDSVCVTVHRLNRKNKRNLDNIEAELVEEDKLALFDARNELRKIA